MTLGERIEELLLERGVSQSELARRAKVPQTTLNSLIRRPRRTSPHLLKIARELGTTPAYLVGETDDPDADGPVPPEYDAETRQLIDEIAVLSPTGRRALLEIVRQMNGSGQSVHDRPRGFRGDGE